MVLPLVVTGVDVLLFVAKDIYIYIYIYIYIMWALCSFLLLIPGNCKCACLPINTCRKIFFLSIMSRLTVRGLVSDSICLLCVKRDWYLSWHPMFLLTSGDSIQLNSLPFLFNGGIVIYALHVYYSSHHTINRPLWCNISSMNNYGLFHHAVRRYNSYDVWCMIHMMVYGMKIKYQLTINTKFMYSMFNPLCPKPEE